MLYCFAVKSMLKLIRIDGSDNEKLIQFIFFTLTELGIF